MDVKIGDMEIQNTMKKDIKITNRYPALKIISLIYQIIGYLTSGMVLIIFIGLIIDKKTIGIDDILTLSGSLIIILAIFAFSEFVRLFIDIEENTRQKK